MKRYGSQTGAMELKQMIIIGIIALATGAIGAIAVSIPVSPMTAAQADADSVEEEENATPEDEKFVPAEPTTMKLDPLVVNLMRMEGDASWYLKVEITLELRDGQVEIDLMNPVKEAQMKDLLITYLSGKTREDVGGAENKEFIRRHLLKKLNMDLELDNGITRLYFVEFVAMPQ